MKKTTIIPRSLVLLLISVSVFLGNFAFAQTQVKAQTQLKISKLPLWELGIAGGLLQIPHYVGSNQNYTLPLAVPYLIYRGDIVKADREGIRGELYSSQSLSVDLGFSFGLPVKSSNRIREGMPDLHLTGQIGPRLNWQLGESESGTKYSFHLPIRYAADVKGNTLGWVAEPSFKVLRRNLGADGRYSIRFDAGLLYAQKKYNQYYYEVEPQFATSARPTYTADSGLSNYFIGLGIGYQLSPRTNLNAFVRYKSLGASVVDDSPLVTDESYLAFGIGITWVFRQSDELVW